MYTVRPINSMIAGRHGRAWERCCHLPRPEWPLAELAMFQSTPIRMSDKPLYPKQLRFQSPGPLTATVSQETLSSWQALLHSVYAGLSDPGRHHPHCISLGFRAGARPARNHTCLIPFIHRKENA